VRGASGKKADMLDFVEIDVSANGFDMKARYFKEDADEIFLPLIKTLFELKQTKSDKLIVFLAAPPGAGKTTLSLFLSHLGRQAGGETIQSVGMDGFHYPQKYLDSHFINKNGKNVLLRDIKGSPESFDLCELTDAIKRMQTRDILWPAYDRNLHDVVPDAVQAKSGIVLIEGNWLLLDEDGWRGLQPLCGYSIFISAEEPMLKNRLIQRKIRGGTSPQEANLYYERSDGPNVWRALNNRLPSDCLLHLSESGKYSVKK